MTPEEKNDKELQRILSESRAMVALIFVFFILGAILCIASFIGESQTVDVQYVDAKIVNIALDTAHKSVIYVVDYEGTSYAISDIDAKYADYYDSGDSLPVEVTSYKNGYIRVLADIAAMQKKSKSSLGTASCTS